MAIPTPDTLLIRHPGLKFIDAFDHPEQSKKFAFGQALSLILASTGVINGWMYEKEAVNIPSVQAALTYTLIMIGSVSYHFLFAEARVPVIDLMKMHKYIMLGAVLFDVAANWLVVKAFSELQIPEVMVFSGLSTPVSIAIAWFGPDQGLNTLVCKYLEYFSACRDTFVLFSCRARSNGSVLGISYAVSSAVACSIKLFPGTGG